MIYFYFKDYDRVCYLNKFILFIIFFNFFVNMVVYFFFYFYFMYQRNLNVFFFLLLQKQIYELNKMQKKSFIRVYEEVVFLIFIVIVNIF